MHLGFCACLSEAFQAEEPETLAILIFVMCVSLDLAINILRSSVSLIAAGLVAIVPETQFLFHI